MRCVKGNNYNSSTAGLEKNAWNKWAGFGEQSVCVTMWVNGGDNATSTGKSVSNVFCTETIFDRWFLVIRKNKCIQKRHITFRGL